MSNKPIKFSDRNKQWMQARKKGIRIQDPEYHYIFTEGTKTEPQYFQAIKNIINNKCEQNRVQIDIAGTGFNTIGILEYAKQTLEICPITYKHIWIVYDTDDFKKDDINKVDILCKKYSNSLTTFHAIWSNQCIELWFLLHYMYMNSNISRNEYINKLNIELRKENNNIYQKNREYMFSILQPKIKIAIKNAKRLAKQNNQKTPADSAPGTQVYLLIESLLEYL